MTTKPTGPLADLKADAAKIGRLREQLEEAIAGRNDRVREYVDEGHTVQAVAAAADLSRPRIIALLAQPVG